MENIKWTLSGWEEHGGYDCMTGSYFIIENGEEIAALDGSVFGQSQCDTSFVPTKKMKQYARLMTSAPRLLEALEECAEYLQKAGKWDESHGIWMNATEAIKEAYGE